MTPLETYQQLRARLVEVRQCHGGRESVEEDALLDEMDVAWAQLTDSERAQLTES